MSWQETAAPVELSVTCGGRHHRLRWDRGRVDVLDHEDLDAELALVALGGTEPACLSHLRLWDDAIADGGFLAEWVDEAHLTAARLSWLAMALERMAGEGFHEFLRDLPLRRAERMGHVLRHFPRPWLDRAACTISAAIESGNDGDRVLCEHAPGLLGAAVAGRLRYCFVDAIGGSQLTVGTAALVPLTINVEAGVSASIHGRLIGADRRVDVQVDPGWLHRVWGAGLGVVEGGLVLDAEPELDDIGVTSARLTVVEWSDSSEPVATTRRATFLNREWALKPLSPA